MLIHDRRKVKRNNKSFFKECERFLKTFGYSVQSHAPDYSSISFLCYDKILENYPSIICFINSRGKKSMVISDSTSYRICGQLTTGEIGFKPNNLQVYLNTFKHFGDLAANNPPR